jgi:RNA polymerase sigma-70 factor (ECF subfamily)
LFTIARHALIDEFRSQNKLAQLDQEQLANIESKEIENSDMVSAFNSALARLNFYQREAFILQQEGFSVSEISHITHCEFETVKSRLRYAKQNLRTMIQEYCDE